MAPATRAINNVLFRTTSPCKPSGRPRGCISCGQLCLRSTASRGSRQFDPLWIRCQSAHYHYVTVFCERADRVWLLDPLKKCPQQFLASELLIFLKEMYRSPYFAIFLLQNNSGSIGKTESNVNTQLNQSSNHHDPTVDQDRDDDRTSTSASLNPTSDNIPPCTTPRGIYVCSIR